MENGEMRVASARIGSSSIWRSGGAIDVFSGSSRREDDEQELTWAAIEKLPMHLRMKRGMLTESQGQITEIDINKVGPLQRKNLVERLIKIVEEDKEKLLLKFRERNFDEPLEEILLQLITGRSFSKVGLDIPTIEVRFEHLNVEAGAHVGSDGFLGL